MARHVPGASKLSDTSGAHLWHQQCREWFWRLAHSVWPFAIWYGRRFSAAADRGVERSIWEVPGGISSNHHGHMGASPGQAFCQWYFCFEHERYLSSPWRRYQVFRHRQSVCHAAASLLSSSLIKTAQLVFCPTFPTLPHHFEQLGIQI